VSRDRRLYGAVVLAVAAFAAAVTLQIVRDNAYPREESAERDLLYVQSPAALRRMALSFDALAADVYWIRALQHYGGDRLSKTKERKYALLYPLLDLATSLDPYFTIAYRFGAIFLSEAYPGGPGRPDQAIKLLEKGIAVQPGKWQYYHDIAFVHYWQLHDMEAAAKWFRMGAMQPGAPNWLEPVAASMLVQGGDRASARFLLQQILQSEEKWLQRSAERGLLQLDALDAVDQLHAVVQRFPPPAGERYSWAWLNRRGVMRGIPADPTGVPFDLDPATGEVTVSKSSQLSPMPGKPGNPGTPQ
jgi:tetratricopeptide (TPR) repeat protein